MQVKPRTTEELQAANPRVLGHSFENETPYAEQWHLGVERRLFTRDGASSSTYAGSAGKHLVFCYNPNEVQPGIGSQESRRLIQPLNRLNNMLQCDPRNSSTYHSGQLKVTQRFSGGLQFLVQLHLREVARLRRVGGERRRRRRQSADRHRSRTPVTARRDSTCAIAPSSAGSASCRGGPSRRWLPRAALLGAVVGGWQLAGHRDDHDRPAVHGVHADRRQQRRAELAEPDRIRGAGQPDASISGSTRRDFVAPPANTYGNTGRGILYGPGHVNFDTSLSKRFTRRGPNQRRVPMGCVQPVQSPGFRFPESELRLADRGTHHVDGRRQPIDAVLDQDEFLAFSISEGHVNRRNR